MIAFATQSPNIPSHTPTTPRASMTPSIYAPIILKHTIHMELIHIGYCASPAALNVVGSV